jgi:hypothetical protein
MPSMPNYYVGKGSQFTMLDRQFDNPSQYDDILESIYERLGKLAKDHANSGDLSAGDADHFHAHWLGKWWPELPVEDVLRTGYYLAIQHAKKKDKPIESIWVCADEKAFHVYIVEGKRQITVIVFTPQPIEHVPEEDLTKDEEIWVVKAKDKWDKKPYEDAGKAPATDITVERDNYTVDARRNACEIILKQLRYA